MPSKGSLREGPSRSAPPHAERSTSSCPCQKIASEKGMSKPGQNGRCLLSCTEAHRKLSSLSGLLSGGGGLLGQMSREGRWKIFMCFVFMSSLWVALCNNRKRQFVHKLLVQFLVPLNPRPTGPKKLWLPIYGNATKRGIIKRDVTVPHKATKSTKHNFSQQLPVGGFAFEYRVKISTCGSFA